jgi:predicted CopG family antitoxin
MTKILGTRVTQSVYDAFIKKAKAQNKTVSELLRELIEKACVNTTLTAEGDQTM